MSLITPAQAAQYFYNAGFRGSDLVTITAISMAEAGTQSNGQQYINTDAVGNGAVGISQIQAGAHNASFNAEFPTSSLYDPQTNANAAYTLFTSPGSGGFNNWTTYTGGEYQNFLTTAQNAVSSIGSPTTGTGSGSATTTTGSGNSSPGDWLTSLLQGGGESIGVGALTFIAALVLIALGLYALFHKQINNAVKDSVEVAAMVPK